MKSRTVSSINELFKSLRAEKWGKTWKKKDANSNKTGQTYKSPFISLLIMLWKAVENSKVYI